MPYSGKEILDHVLEQSSSYREIWEDRLQSLREAFPDSLEELEMIIDLYTKDEIVKIFYLLLHPEFESFTLNQISNGLDLLLYLHYFIYARMEARRYFELDNAYTLHEKLPISDNNKEYYNFYGEVYCKAGERFSSDYIFQDNWKTKYPSVARSKEIGGYFEYGSNVEFVHHISLIADGATPMLDPKDLPEDVVEKCTFTNNGVKLFRPDLFWRVALGLILGDDSMPSPPEFMQSLSFIDIKNQRKKFRTFVDNLFIQTSNSPMLAKRIFLEFIQGELVNCFSQCFVSWNPETPHLFPSGIMGLVMWRSPANSNYSTKEIQKNSLSSSYAVCGDITLSMLTEDGKWIRLNDPTEVDLHDAVRMSLGIDKHDPERLGVVALYRTAMTGNHPYHPKLKHHMRIFSGQLPESWDRVVGYSDGLKIRHSIHAVVDIDEPGREFSIDDLAPYVYARPDLCIFLRLMSLAGRTDERGDHVSLMRIERLKSQS